MNPATPAEVWKGSPPSDACLGICLRLAPSRRGAGLRAQSSIPGTTYSKPAPFVLHQAVMLGAVCWERGCSAPGHANPSEEAPGAACPPPGVTAVSSAPQPPGFNSEFARGKAFGPILGEDWGWSGIQGHFRILESQNPSRAGLGGTSGSSRCNPCPSRRSPRRHPSFISAPRKGCKVKTRGKLARGCV